MSKLPSVENLLRKAAAKTKADGTPCKRPRISVGQSLYLDVQGRGPNKPGSAIWEFRQKIPGTNRSRSILLGSALGDGALTTVEAMRARWAYDGEQKEIAHVAAVVAAPSAPSMKFADAVAKFEERKQPDADVLARLKKYAAKKLNGKAIALITPADIADVMTAAKWDGVRVHTAGRVRADIEAVLRVNGMYENNPAAWLKVKDQLPDKPAHEGKIEHHPSLAWQRVPEFFAFVEANNGNTQAKAIRFAVLTAARIGEVLGLTWGEIDLTEKLWTVPASRMKARRDHIVPLTDAAIKLLGERGADDERVFVVSSKTTQRLLQKFEKNSVQHGFRTTFGTWGQENGIRTEVLDMALAHGKGKGDDDDASAARIRAAYLRSDLLVERRDAMARWTSFAMAA